MDNTTSDWHLAGNDAIDPMNHFLGTLGSQPLVVRTNHWANPSASERMRVSVTGNVGVGTDDPTQGRLVIEDSAVPLALKETGQGLASGGLWRLVLDGGALRFEANAASGGDFSTYSTPLSMAPGGNVGVGSPPQAARLSVAGSNGGGIAVDSGASNGVALTLRSSGAGWGSGVQLLNTTASTGCNYGIYAGSDGSLHIADTTSGADRLIVNSTGNVGIGTRTAPNARLVVSGASKAVSIDPGDNNPNVAGALGFNRNTPDGRIFDTAFNAYQLSAYKGGLLFEVYDGTGRQITPQALAVLSNGNVRVGKALYATDTIFSEKLPLAPNWGDLYANAGTSVPTDLNMLPKKTECKMLFYDFGGDNWAGMGVSYHGHIWLRVGTSADNQRWYRFTTAGMESVSMAMIRARNSRF